MLWQLAPDRAQRVIAGKDPEDGAVFVDANQATDFLDSLA